MQRYTLFGNHQNFSAIIFKNKATFSRLLTNIKGNPYKRRHFWTKSLGTTSSQCWYAQSINDEIAGIRDLPVSVSEYSTFGGTWLPAPLKASRPQGRVITIRGSCRGNLGNCLFSVILVMRRHFLHQTTTKTTPLKLFLFCNKVVFTRK